MHFSDINIKCLKLDQIKILSILGLALTIH